MKIIINQKSVSPPNFGLWYFKWIQALDCGHLNCFFGFSFLIILNTYVLLAATPLKVSRGGLVLEGGHFFLGAIYIRRLVTFPNIVINISRTFDKHRHHVTFI